MAASVPLTAVQITDADLLTIEGNTVELAEGSATPYESCKHPTGIFQIAEVTLLFFFLRAGSSSFCEWNITQSTPVFGSSQRRALL